MWLLDNEVARNMQSAIDSGFKPSADQLAEFSASMGGNGFGHDRIMSRDGATANITIRGALTASPNFFAMLFGGGNTVYSDIVDALEAAENDDSVENIDLYVDSPGGSVDGLFETLAAIENTTKPTRSIVSSKAASAAFAIVAATDTIEATSKATRFGSVGVVVDMPVADDIISITSTNAPNKRPDVSTEAGVAAVREELDALHELFVESIANGRGVSTEKVNAEYGRGGMLLSGEALKRGMIDAVQAVKTKPTAEKGGDDPKVKTMDLQTLKAQHPDVFAAAVETGVEQERERVNAHLIMGEQCGAMETAIKAISEGAEMSPTLTAKYVTAGVNRNNVDERQQETEEANADAGQSDEHKSKSVGAAILAAAAAAKGIELK